MIAHIALVVWPQSGWAARIVAPVGKGIEFLDAHWKAVLILIAPFVAPIVSPVARDVARRITKVGPVEMSPVPLEPEGPHEKPTHNPQGGGDEG
jgi:hypothetical protein